ncbi:MAG TPA: hypothetical protein VFB50_22665, partial [Chloroflexota bacterium]|nr:hypothetical protein [Chloroflexota bacterium]
VPNGSPMPSEAAAERQISVRAPTWPTMAPRMFNEMRDAARPAFTSGMAMEVDTTTTFDTVAERVYQDDGVHYTALGNRLVAEAIQPALNHPTCR